MKFVRSSIAFAVLVAATGGVGAAQAQGGVPRAASTSSRASAAIAAPSPTRSATDSIGNAPVSEATSRHPPADASQRHFTDAVAAMARNDYTAAASDIREATAYLRHEAQRATGHAKHELATSATELDRLADRVGQGAVRDERSVAGAFARAEHALALAHRSAAADAWARNEYQRTGHELKAAAVGLEDAAGWIGGTAEAGISASVSAARRVGDALVAEGAWTRDEVARALESLGRGIDTLGRKLAEGGNAQARHAPA
jgi:hypothetical protein